MYSSPLGRFQGAIVGAAVGARQNLYAKSSLPEHLPWENDWLQRWDLSPACKNMENFENVPNASSPLKGEEENENVAKAFLAALPSLLCREGMGNGGSPTFEREMSILIPCDRLLARALWSTLPPSAFLNEILASRACQEMETKYLHSWQRMVALLDRNAPLEEAKEHFGRCSVRWGAYCFLGAVEHFSIAVGRAAWLGREAAAIAGALAGAYVGIEGIPTAWSIDSPDRFSSFQILGARAIARWAGANSLPATASWLDFPAVVPYPLRTNRCRDRLELQ